MKDKPVTFLQRLKVSLTRSLCSNFNVQQQLSTGWHLNEGRRRGQLIRTSDNNMTKLQLIYAGCSMLCFPPLSSVSQFVCFAVLPQFGCCQALPADSSASLTPTPSIPTVHSGVSTQSYSPEAHGNVMDGLTIQ